MNSQVFQAPPSSYSESGTGLAAGTRVVQAEGCLFVVAGEETSDVAVVWVHGNASDCGYESAALAWMADALQALCIGVEWPGYGPLQAQQKPSVEACDAAVAAGLRLAGPHRRVLLVGRSLGTGSASRAARRAGPELGERLVGLMLWSPMTSVAGIAANVVGGLLGAFVPKRWDVVDEVAHLTCPLVIVAGAQDTLTPLSMAEAVFKAAKSRDKALHVVPAADHNNGWQFAEDIGARMRHMIVGKGEEEKEEEEQLVHAAEAPVVPNVREAVPQVDVSQEQAEIVIVGAGPVGLFLAVSLCALGVDPRSILLLEKHGAYQRHHVLRLEASSLRGAPKEVAKLIEPLVGVTKTALLETTLSDEAARRGLRVARPCFVQDCVAQLPARAAVIVAADGSKSVARTQLLGPEGGRETLQYVLDVRLEIVGLAADKSAHKLSVMQQLAALGQARHVVEESVSRTRTEKGAFPCTLRLLIGRAEHEALREEGASLREPLSLPRDSALLPAQVNATIRGWLLFRQSVFPAERYTNVRCTSLDLAVYHASVLGVRRDDGRAVFCVGDAAFGVPFFRALNNGLLSATQLAGVIVEELRVGASLRPVAPTLVLAASKSSIPVATGDDQGGFFANMMQSFAASAGISKNLADISARGATEMAEDLFTSAEKDPVLRYHQFMGRLITREFSAARSKRDGLAIVRLANSVRNNSSMSKLSSGGSTAKLDPQRDDPFAQ
jgi:pimeloyl-ACP methyl ester carboxylesterase/2-polyprenyl-6-methoxyphenol hydroxylase-like FAD-dependent oxidoreductase